MLSGISFVIYAFADFKISCSGLLVIYNIRVLLSEKDLICFVSDLIQLRLLSRIIISGKISRRTDDEPPVILIDTVKPVDNSNIFTITLKDEFKFEELVLLKNKLCEHQGSDPVMLKVDDDGVEAKILTASMFWVESSNDLVNSLNKIFDQRISIDISSMDSNSVGEEQAA